MLNRLWIPRIDANLCDGCGICVTKCPTGALEMRNGKAIVAHPERCIYCTDCEASCPTNAIQLPYLVCKANGMERRNAHGDSAASQLPEWTVLQGESREPNT